MKVHQISDLHLEFADLYLPGGDVLILGGDVCEAKNIRPENYKHQPSDNNPKRIDRYARFFAEELTKYSKVLYVLGNHEHYGYVFDDTLDLLRTLMPDNVTILEKSSIELDGVVFIGATLWTDLNNNDPLTDWTLRRNMNDFAVIKKQYGDVTKRLHPQDTYEDHKAALAYIDSAVALAGDKPCVVLTHHAPSRLSIHEQFKHEYKMNGGFASNLDDFILNRPQIKYWTHGHMHNPCNYLVGETKIICNPRGYSGYERRAKQFDPTVGFEL